MDLSNLHPDLKDNYIIEKLESSTPEERSESALRLLRNLDDRVPMTEAQLYSPNSLRPKEEFEDHVKYTRDFFKYISDIDLSPEDMKELKHIIKKSEENERKSRWLYTQSLPLLESKLRFLPHHQLPPYIYEWEKSILGEYYKGDLNDLKFTKKLLGRGGFACVYLVKGLEDKYAMKIFHPPWKFPMEGTMGSFSRGVINKMIVENVKDKKDLLGGYTKFPKVKAFSPEKRWREPDEPWYLMDFVEGKSATKRLFGREPADDKLKKLATEGYADMLSYLHSKDHVFQDNNWGAVMIGDEDSSIIDFDFVSKADSKPPVRCFTVNYFSNSQLKETDVVTKNSDLQSFAKMLDHLYVGTPLTRNRDEHRGFEIERRYPSERKQKLPKGLGDVVEQVLVEPNSNISIDDFCSAIKEI
jgi:hypothetical protein